MLSAANTFGAVFVGIVNSLDLIVDTIFDSTCSTSAAGINWLDNCSRSISTKSARPFVNLVRCAE